MKPLCVNLLLIYFCIICALIFSTRLLFAANHGAGFVNATLKNLGARADRKQASVFLEESVVVLGFFCAEETEVMKLQR